MCTQVELNQITGEVSRQMQHILGSKLRKIILYGSYARGDFDAESDIDMMVLADIPADELNAYRKQVNRVASKIGLDHDIMLTISLKDRHFFTSHCSILPFYRKVADEGGSIYGN